jgi:hypothetical protein
MPLQTLTTRGRDLDRPDGPRTAARGLGQPRFLAKYVAGIDYLVPFLDRDRLLLGSRRDLVPLRVPADFGWWSMLLLPITLAIFGLLNRWQTRHVFRRLDIQPGNDARGFVGYLLVSQVLTSATALRG